MRSGATWVSSGVRSRLPGAEVITTVDRRVQEAAEQAMAGHAGAVVVLDPRNGDVLAMVSTPAFDIDRFTGTIDRAAWLAVVKDPAHPLLNRTIQTQYAPGSVFKIIVAAAGLQEGTLTPMDRLRCTGEFHLGGVTFKDWKKEGHGSVDLLRAVNQSCNIYFYHYGLRIGGSAITRYAAMFGLGRPTGVVFGGEKSGLIPHPRSARGRKGAVWHAGDTVNMSIGQGALLVTPMQVARFMAAVANGGVLWRPRLVQRVERGQDVVWSDGGRGDRSRGTVPDGLGISPPESVVGRQRGRHGRGRPHPRPRRGREDRYRPDDRELQVGQGTGSRVVRQLCSGPRT